MLLGYRGPHHCHGRSGAVDFATGSRMSILLTPTMPYPADLRAVISAAVTQDDSHQNRAMAIGIYEPKRAPGPALSGQVVRDPW